MWRFIDHSTFDSTVNALASFAIDDTLCEAVGSSASPSIIRTWVHDRTVALGIQDSRLPQIGSGISFLNSNNWNAIVRNSGGLAVVLDKGILNISMIIPDQKTSIDDAYEQMVHLVRHMLSPFHKNVEAREIVGSYCPGKYDLSIDGKKFAGISQRRVRKGIAVQVYLCCDGSGAERANLIKQFYEHALKDETPSPTYPVIIPETMASLTELLKQPISAQLLIDLLRQAMTSLYGTLTCSELTADELKLYEKNYERIVQRNEKTLVTYL